MFNENYLKSGKARIVRERVIEQMHKLDMDQQTLGERIAAVTGKPFVSTSISLWVTGRRNVPIKYLDPLSTILQVTKPYLLGRTNDPQADWDEVEQNELEQPNLYEITPAQLYAYDKLPVYVSFSGFEFEDGWAIYNRNARVFQFWDRPITEKTIKRIGAKLFTTNLRELDNALQHRKALDYAGVMSADTVYIQMNTADAEIRALYDGWYRHNEDHTALINSTGRALPYSGLKKNYQAFTYKMKHTIAEV